MERDFAAYLFTLFCPLFTSGASFSIAHEYSVRNLNALSTTNQAQHQPLMTSLFETSTLPQSQTANQYEQWQ